MTKTKFLGEICMFSYVIWEEHFFSRQKLTSVKYENVACVNGPNGVVVVQRCGDELHSRVQWGQQSNSGETCHPAHTGDHSQPTVPGSQYTVPGSQYTVPGSQYTVPAICLMLPSPQCALPTYLLKVAYAFCSLYICLRLYLPQCSIPTLYV